MMPKRVKSVWLALLAGVAWAYAVLPARAQQAPARADTPQDRARAAAQIPLDLLPPHAREGTRHTLQKPTVFSRGPAEAFACEPSLYYWFLDHPDRAVTAWRRLGAKCLTITDRGGGRFGWSDENGSDIVWETVYRTPELRIWYAEGKARPSPLLPLVSVKAVVLLHHVEARDRKGAPLVRHQTDMFLRTDSMAANLASKMMGTSPARMAEQNLGQLQMFFAGLAWYLHRHPERADALLSESASTAPPATSGLVRRAPGQALRLDRSFPSRLYSALPLAPRKRRRAVSTPSLTPLPAGRHTLTMNPSALAVVLACGVNGLGAIRSLAQARIPTLVVTLSAADPVLHSRHARKHVLRNAADPLTELFRLLRGLDERPTVVLPASDYFVHLLAEHRAALAETCHFAMPGNDLLTVFRDKALETRFVAATGVPLPRTVQDLPPMPATLLRKLDLPILLKPRTTEDKLWFGRKNFLTTNAEELGSVYRAHAGELHRLLAQECIPGDDPALWVCDCVFDRRSELVAAFTFRKLSTAPSHMGVTSLGVSERNAELIELVAALGKKLGYVGPADIDFKYDARDGRYKYLEINPRIGMCNYFGARCGVNTVRDAYLVAAGADVPPRAGRQKEGVVYVNLHDDLYNRHKEGQGLPALVRTYLDLAGREWVGAYFDWDDARPVVLAGWRNLGNWVHSLRGKLRHALSPRRSLQRRSAREELACR